MPHFQSPKNDVFFLSDDDVSNGWIDTLPYGSRKITDQQAREITSSASKILITKSVTRRQALLALLAAGKLDAVELIVQNSPRAVQIAWESAGTFERDNQLIDSLGSQAGFSDEDIDNLFEQAAKL